MVPPGACAIVVSLRYVRRLMGELCGKGGRFASLLLCDDKLCHAIVGFYQKAIRTTVVTTNVTCTTDTNMGPHQMTETEGGGANAVTCIALSKMILARVTIKMMMIPIVKIPGATNIPCQ